MEKIKRSGDFSTARKSGRRHHPQGKGGEIQTKSLHWYGLPTSGGRRAFRLGYRVFTGQTRRIHVYLQWEKQTQNKSPRAHDPWSGSLGGSRLRALSPARRARCGARSARRHQHRPVVREQHRVEGGDGLHSQHGLRFQSQARCVRLFVVRRQGDLRSYGRWFFYDLNLLWMIRGGQKSPLFYCQKPLFLLKIQTYGWF